MNSNFGRENQLSQYIHPIHGRFPWFFIPRNTRLKQTKWHSVSEQRHVLEYPADALTRSKIKTPGGKYTFAFLSKRVSPRGNRIKCHPHHLPTSLRARLHRSAPSAKRRKARERERETARGRSCFASAHDIACTRTERFAECSFSLAAW